VSDALQAQTAYSQALLARNRAEGDWLTMQGVLAADMDLSPDEALDLPAVMEGTQSDANFSRSVSDLMNEARRLHPEVLAAQSPGRRGGGESGPDESAGIAGTEPRSEVPAK
jgi:outer membrane protein